MPAACSQSDVAADDQVEVGPDGEVAGADDRDVGPGVVEAEFGDQAIRSPVLAGGPQGQAGLGDVVDVAELEGFGLDQVGRGHGGEDASTEEFLEHPRPAPTASRVADLFLLAEPHGPRTEEAERRRAWRSCQTPWIDQAGEDRQGLGQVHPVGPASAVGAAEDRLATTIACRWGRIGRRGRTSRAARRPIGRRAGSSSPSARFGGGAGRSWPGVSTTAACASGFERRTGGSRRPSPWPLAASGRGRRVRVRLDDLGQEVAVLGVVADDGEIRGVPPGLERAPVTIRDGGPGGSAR